MSDEFTTDFSESFTGNITGNCMEARINRVCTWVAEQMTSGNPHKAPLADLLTVAKAAQDWLNMHRDSESGIAVIDPVKAGLWKQCPPVD